MNHKYKSLVIFISVVFISVLGTSLVAAQDEGDAVANLSNSYDLQELGGMTSRLAPHGNDLMGDMIDKNTGGITFEHTDVSVPGNSNLEVALRRKMKQGAFINTPYQQGFGDWVLDIPIAYTAYAPNTGTPVEPQFNSGCLTNQGPMNRTARTSGSIDILPEQHVSGVTLHVPGKALSGSPTTLGTISDPKQNWVSVSNSTDFAGRCATVVVAPDGTTYKFGRSVIRRASSLTFPYTTSFSGDFSNSALALGTLGRRYAVYLVTEVVDVNGNWVRYDYNNRAELTSIYSNDGRSIALNYASFVPDISVRNSRRISSVTTNGRTWNYSYVRAPNSDASFGALHKVTLPDGRFWALGNNVTGMREMSFEVRVDYRCLPRDYTFSIKHPDGAVGTFSLAETRHIKNAADLGQSDDAWDHWMLPTNIPHVTDNSQCNVTSSPNRPPFYRDETWPVYRTMALKSKTISGSGLPAAAWTYEYRNYSGGALDNNWTRITGPDGTKRLYTHRAIGLDHGLLKRIDVTPVSGAGETITYDYNLSEPVYSSCIAGGAFGDSAGMCHAYKKRPITKVVQQRDGSTFTTESIYNQNGANRFIDFGHPNKERRYSSVSGSTAPRETITSYEHKTAKNIIGLVKRVVQNGREMSTYSYDTLGQLTNQTRYGHPYKTFTYHTVNPYRGALATITDAMGREIYRTDYKRGTPQSTRRPDNVWLSVAIDDNGWLMSSTDAMSNTTSYGRDSMGRLTLIDPPGPWDNTSVAYNFSGGGAVQTITRGQSRETVTYDKMYRPVLERSQSLDTGWSSYVRTNYHPAGQVKFKSQPSTNSNESKGVDYAYDGLGRLTQKRENVSPFATQKHRYLSGNRHEVTDALNHKTTNYRDGYNGPTEGELIRISQPLGVNTTLYRNIWGQLTRVRQTGGHNGYGVDQSHYYYYDSRQRVCRYRTPEGRDTLNTYDASGYLIAYAKGMNSGTSCNTPSGQSLVNLTLDDLARVTKTDFADVNTPDISVTYDDNGNILTNNRAGVNWTYTYDELNHLKSESLDVDGRSFNLSYNYDSSENLIQRTFPSGRVVTYTHDGLGRERSAISGSVSYANNINYHPSNLVSSMTYGNGQVFTQTLNNRLLPQRLLAQKGATKAMDINYSYDARSSIRTMDDGIDYQSFDYDPLGRLKTANGGWGAGAFIYDSLGNIRSKTLGARQVNVSYDLFNRATQSQDTAGSVRNISYDSRGNVSALGALSFAYDYSDQPVRLSGSSSGTYRYDGNLKRVKAVVNGKTIYNVYDSSGSLVHVDKGKLALVPYKRFIIPVSSPSATDYIKVAGITVARVTENKVTYLHSNHLGSAVAGTNTSGALAWREQYMPFGEKRIANAANDDQASFTGHIDDSATGLTYMQARYYDPVIGRFLSIDPIGFTHENPASFNRYSYANNSPYSFVDPDGLAPDHIMDIRHAGLGQFAAENPKQAVAMVGFAVTAPLVSAGVIAYSPAALAACSASCSTIAIGATAGGALEGANQLEAGEFNGAKLATSVAIGAAGGTGSLFGKNLGQNMLGAAGGASGATFLSNIPAVANDEIGADQALVSTFQNGAAAAGGTFIGAITARALTATTGFGGLGNLSNGGAALGASSGEIGAATTVNLLNSDDE